MRRSDGMVTAAPVVTPDMLPTPLAQVLDELAREAQPFRAVHRMVDAFEVFVKLHTVLLVSRFAEAAAPDAPAGAAALRRFLAEGLARPSLGLWWAFARDAGAALADLGVAEPTPSLFATVKKGGSLFTAADEFLAFRNGYAHGATPDDEACRVDLAKFRPRLEALCASAMALASASLVAVQADGAALSLRGLSPLSVTVPRGTLPGRCYLVRDGNLLLDLHPLLVWLPGRRGTGAFFYNDLKKNTATALHYAWAERVRTTALASALLERYPLDAWSALATPDDARIRERIASLTEQFQGRRADLRAILADVGTRPSGALFLWGPPGVGKSALVARAIDFLGWSTEAQEAAYPDVAMPVCDGASLSITVVSALVRRAGASDVREVFESLNRQLDRRFATGLPGASDAHHAARLLTERLALIGPRLAAHQRLLVVIDGLDEMVEHTDFVQGLPRMAPGRVRLLYASREQPALRTDVYERFDPGSRAEHRLQGLGADDVRALLYAATDKYATQSGWVDAVVRRSEGNPLYLRLLCDALERRELRLNDVESLPRGMAELYDGVLRRVATTPGAEDLLCLLAAAKAFIRDDLAAELLALAQPGFNAGLAQRAREACADVLVDDPSTPAQDWQLFHESLREHLRRVREAAVASWDERLAAWGERWRERTGAARTYALRWTPVHLEAVARRCEGDKREAEARMADDRLLTLVDDAEFRETNFRVCGHGEALRKAIRLAQRVAVRRHRAGEPDIARIARYAEWTWGEEARFYPKQLGQLRQMHAKGNWSDLAELTKMGPRPRDRVLLALRALWGDDGGRHTRPRLDAAAQEAIRSWRVDSDETALERLWAALGPSD